MKKELRICSCGRLHFLNSHIITTAIEVDKEVLFICGNCGKATRIGADCVQDYWNDSDDIVYEMYARNASDNDFMLGVQDFRENAYGSDESKRIFQVVYSVGKPVSMMTGMNATAYRFGKFEDDWYPDLYKIQTEGITVREIMEFIETWKHDRQTVNMNFLLRTLTDEEAQLLANAYIPGLDWKGTKYERK